MARVRVEGDWSTFELIAAALRSAGLPGVEIEYTFQRAEVVPLSAAPRTMVELAGVSPELAYVDWRNEMLALVDADMCEAQTVSEGVAADVTVLRRAV